MRRKIQVECGPIKVVAIINTRELSRGEMEAARDDLADRLIEAVAATRYLQSPRNRVACR